MSNSRLFSEAGPALLGRCIQRDKEAALFLIGEYPDRMTR